MRTNTPKRNIRGLGVGPNSNHRLRASVKMSIYLLQSKVSSNIKFTFKYNARIFFTPEYTFRSHLVTY